MFSQNRTVSRHYTVVPTAVRPRDARLEGGRDHSNAPPFFLAVCSVCVCISPQRAYFDRPLMQDLLCCATLPELQLFLASIIELYMLYEHIFN